MKKVIALVLAVVICIGAFAGCAPADNGKTIDNLVVGFVPSRDPAEIVTATEPLKKMLTDELTKAGYDVKKVTITVGTNYEVVGEGMGAGTIDVGLIPGSTYVLYSDGAEVILTATRDALSKDSDNAKDWNDGKETATTKNQATGYRALIISGPSAKGQELAKKVNAGEKLTWEDINSAKWSIMSTTSSAGYVYPSIWLQNNYKKGITDLANAVTSDSYGTAFARLAAGQVDLVLCYADARRDNEKKWTTDFKRTASIWDETNVIGVTPSIYNDTVSVSKSSKKITPELKKALQDAFINISKTEDGKKVIDIYNHKGYVVAKDSDYDTERQAQEILKGLKK
ncbi:MAG: PhnD/SsuA/transferrin family substrate-binding protein [Clostridia bacterium]